MHYDEHKFTERELPRNIDFYEIQEDDTAIESSRAIADVYIRDIDLNKLFEKDACRHIRTTYGKYVGVMKDIKNPLSAKGYNTQKMILGIIK